MLSGFWFVVPSFIVTSDDPTLRDSYCCINVHPAQVCATRTGTQQAPEPAPNTPDSTPASHHAQSHSCGHRHTRGKSVLDAKFQTRLSILPFHTPYLSVCADDRSRTFLRFTGERSLTLRQHSNFSVEIQLHDHDAAASVSPMFHMLYPVLRSLCCTR